MRICVYAHSSTAWFFRALIDASRAAGDGIEWSVIQPQWHFMDVLKPCVAPDSHCYLYQDFDAHYRRCGEAQIREAMECGDGLITSLLKDKDGYRWLDKEEQLRRASVIHKVYGEFVRRIGPDCVLFPDVETVDGFVLLNLCNELGIRVLYYTSMRTLPRGFLSPTACETLPSNFGAYFSRHRAGQE